MWQYRELVSCPLTVILGAFEHRGLSGYVVLPLLNLRFNILVDENGVVKCATNVPYPDWSARLYEICYALYLGKVSELDALKKVEAVSMFYGGVGVYAVIGGEILPVSIDFVDRSLFQFYILPSTIRTNYKAASLSDWITVQFALREGLAEVLLNECQYIGSSDGDVCIIETSHGKLAITASSKLHRVWNGYIRVVPENAPLRHVVAFDNLGRGEKR